MQISAILWEDNRMAGLTRRTLLKQASIGAAAVGALTGPGAIAHALPEARAAELPAEDFHGHLVAHVRNARTGEIALLFDTKEVIIHDRALAARLVKATRSAGSRHAG
jgi:hypothetical protein